MPQIFPMNWLMISISLLMSLLTMIIIMYFIKFNNLKISYFKKKNSFSPNYKW
nr:ATP synthase F0 subunit 8 [Dermacentor (Indocentor) sp.]